MRLSLLDRALQSAAAALCLKACVTFLALATTAPAHADSDREAMVKAAIVFKLARYVSWPEEAFAARPDSLRICLTGDPAMVEAMSQAKGREVDGRAVDVVPVNDPEFLPGCNMLYIGAAEAGRLDRLADSLREQPVVSVSELSGFASSAGMIELVRRDRRFGFRINLANARSSGVEVSAQLLDLADVIDTDAGDGSAVSGK